MEAGSIGRLGRGARHPDARRSLAGVPRRRGLLGLITAIVGAAAGSNLAVIVFDIVEDRRPIIVSEAAVAIEVPARVDVEWSFLPEGARFAGSLHHLA